MRWLKATSGLVGLLLAGVAVTPAHAQTIRERQWHLNAMKADDIWKTSTGKGMTVAVIDSGVEEIPELEGQVLSGKDFAAGEKGYKGDERNDYEGHGTAMAALIVGSGKHPSGDGAFGLAPGAKILPVRVPHEFNDTRPSWTAAIRYAAESEAKIINISLATGKDDPERAGAVKYALSKGKLIFAGVGNDGDTTNSTLYPAATPGVVGVGAVGLEGAATRESQHGAQVDISAPGVDIVTGCGRKTGLCTSHGTSDATALASASAALLWAVHPDWTNNQVLRVLLDTAGKPVDGVRRNDYVGYGVVRPRVAVVEERDPGPADVFPLPELAAGGPSTGRKTPPRPAPQARSGVREGGGGFPWLGLGLAAGVLIGGAVAAAAAVRRRR
ncbi:type VII secretion-associated serine protease mycosin [Streptomyces sp. NBC_00249]|uniref:type VII secretion-associated serine protease mycosin n=1 Tax=Streptomyces sp. NBC_00249 TaxID=2975690 RepID=UPI0022587C40|nr:type VII secretion-associated serine protease mycosin [Streptomyces sp. NBC_00249]MCX5199621.1 type VII secretion-associated serine protease mycosin [Streptomyces sp. NBC_00249]